MKHYTNFEADVKGGDRDSDVLGRPDANVRHFKPGMIAFLPGLEGLTSYESGF